MTAVVVLAYDGCIVDSLDARAFAVHEAMLAEQVRVALDNVRALIAGRSLGEAVHAAANAHAPHADATLLEIAALRADRAYSAISARGLALMPDAADFVQQASSRSRIFIRADSRRQDVSSLLNMSQLESHVAFTRCADDGGLRASTAGDLTTRSVHVAYDQIVARLVSRGVAPPECIVYEPDALAQDIAQRAGFVVHPAIPRPHA